MAHKEYNSKTCINFSWCIACALLVSLAAVTPTNRTGLQLHRATWKGRNLPETGFLEHRLLLLGLFVPSFFCSHTLHSDPPFPLSFPTLHFSCKHPIISFVPFRDPLKCSITDYMQSSDFLCSSPKPPIISPAPLWQHLLSVCSQKQVIQCSKLLGLLQVPLLDPSDPPQIFV